MLGAVGLAGLAGALFSPIAGRLSGIYLGLASIGLVFIGQYILFNAAGVTGGFNGRDAPPFSLFGFSFSDSDPDNLLVFGVRFGGLERLWYLGVALIAVSWWYGRNLVRSRPGRALQQVRDSVTAAAVMGVNVPVYRAAAFTVSSMYAGLGGVFLALAFGRIVPESFGFLVSIDFLVMIVVGGLGSIGGAVAGAVLISALPQILNHYSESLPLVAEPGSSGLTAAQAARLLYGAAVIAVLIYAPQGLAGLTRRFQHRRISSPASLQPKESTS
jgi:branched-chain amino acid transport system permease protein